MRHPVSLLLAGGLLATAGAVAAGLQASPSSRPPPLRPQRASPTATPAPRRTTERTARLTASAAQAYARRFYTLGANWNPANYRTRTMARRRMAAPRLARALFADPPDDDYVRELREGRQQSRGRVLRAEAAAVTGRAYRVVLVVDERSWALGVAQPVRRDAFQAIVRLVAGTPRIVEWSTVE